MISDAECTSLNTWSRELWVSARFKSPPCSVPPPTNASGFGKRLLSHQLILTFQLHIQRCVSAAVLCLYEASHTSSL